MVDIPQWHLTASLDLDPPIAGEGDIFTDEIQVAGIFLSKARDCILWDGDFQTSFVTVSSVVLRPLS